MIVGPDSDMDSGSWIWTCKRMGMGGPSPRDENLTLMKTWSIKSLTHSKGLTSFLGYCKYDHNISEFFCYILERHKQMKIMRVSLVVHELICVVQPLVETMPPCVLK